MKYGSGTTRVDPRRRALGVAALLAATGVRAQESRGPITIVVGFPAGGTADFGARLLAEMLPPLLGQVVIVENRAGAGGQIAARYVKAAPANGSVLFFSNGHTVVTVPMAFKEPGFDTPRDLRAVAPFSSFELVLVAHPKAEARTFKELLAYFSRMPAERNVAVPAPGSAPEFIVGKLAQSTKLSLQPVAYRGAAPAVQDLLGGQVAAAVLPVGDALPHVRAGKLRALAVTQTTSLLPGCPSFSELGLPELAASDFLGVYAPAGTPDAVVERYGAAIRKIIEMPDAAERIRSQAMQPIAGTAAELERHYAASVSTVRALMIAVDYKPQ